MTKVRRSCQIGFASFFLATVPCLATEEDVLLEARGANARNAYFDVTADDALSARYAATIGEMIGRRMSRLLPPPSGVSQPVVVTLIPTEEFGQPVAFSTRIYGGGQVNVAVAWGETTTRGALERALAQGYLTYLSGAYSTDVVAVPLWLELAVQHMARVQAIPAHARHLAQEAAKERPMRLEEILTAERGDAVEERLEAHAYWLLTFLERDGRRQGQLQNFLIRLLRGQAPLQALTATFGEHVRSMAEAEVWWAVGFNELIQPPTVPIMPADESRRRVRDLSRFAFETREGEAVGLVEDLWEHRVSARLQDELLRRRQLASLEIATIHPFYHNVLLSLDRVFAALLAGDEAAYREAVVVWRHDLREGDELAADTSSILDDLSAELAR